MWGVADMIPSKEEWIQALDDRHGIEFQKKISSTTVAVCGLGGLGSNIAISLARAGIGKLILIDFDKVDITNLHRQQYKANQIGMCKTEALQNNLKEINPYLETKIHTICLDESNAKDVLADADIICEAFDNAEPQHTRDRMYIIKCYSIKPCKRVCSCRVRTKSKGIYFECSIRTA